MGAFGGGNKCNYNDDDDDDVWVVWRLGYRSGGNIGSDGQRSSADAAGGGFAGR